MSQGVKICVGMLVNPDFFYRNNIKITKNAKNLFSIFASSVEEKSKNLIML